MKIVIATSHNSIVFLRKITWTRIPALVTLVILFNTLLMHFTTSSRAEMIKKWYGICYVDSFKLHNMAIRNKRDSVSNWRAHIITVLFWNNVWCCCFREIVDLNRTFLLPRTWQQRNGCDSLWRIVEIGWRWTLNSPGPHQKRNRTCICLLCWWYIRLNRQIQVI